MKVLSVAMQALNKTLNRTVLGGTNTQESLYFKKKIFQNSGDFKTPGGFVPCVQGAQGIEKELNWEKDREHGRNILEQQDGD